MMHELVKFHKPGAGNKEHEERTGEGTEQGAKSVKRKKVELAEAVEEMKLIMKGKKQARNAQHMGSDRRKTLYNK